MSYKFLFIMLIAAALVACGNKGPLVLPDAQTDSQKRDQQEKDAAKKATEPAAKQQ